MKICYVGPCDAVTAAGFEFVRGVPVEVPAELAGREPAARLTPAMVALAAALAVEDTAMATALRDELAGLDRGEGLLAQASFAPAPASKSKSVPTDTVAPQEDDR